MNVGLKIVVSKYNRDKRRDLRGVADDPPDTRI